MLVPEGCFVELIYCSERDLLIRSMRIDDAQVIYDTLLSYGWHPSLAVYENYYKEQIQGQRIVLVAVIRGEVAGYCNLLTSPKEGPWKGKTYPEISDLNVFRHFRRLGIANKLLDMAEREAEKQADRVTLAVGLHWGYGAAQRIYAKRGYIPDGSGLWYNGKQLEEGAACLNDDGLLLYMSKRLGNIQK